MVCGLKYIIVVIDLMQNLQATIAKKNLEAISGGNQSK